nr:sigma-70 family RNA polymerase sigma factor [uncultured Dyadobacter sp.]
MESRCDELHAENDVKLAVEQHVHALEHASDEVIWAKFKEGDEGAFEFIYTKYFPVLYNYGRQFTRNPALAKDIIQDLFIYLQEKKERLGAVSSIKFYLYKSYRNRIVRHLNKENLSLEDVTYQQQIGFEIILANNESADTAIDDELRHKMQRAFDQLTERQKEIIIYYYYEGFNYAQITTIMGFGKIEYARILMSRAIQKLRQLMGVSAVVVEAVLMLMTADR